MTVYLSQIVGQIVWDARGEQLGRCIDVLVADVETGFPPLRAIAVALKGETPNLISADSVAWLTPSIILNTAEPSTYEPRGHELWLARQVLDRQIVDTEGRRLVRVNDLQLARIGSDGSYRVAGVDVGSLGLLRRLGAEGPVRTLLKALHRELPRTTIPWEDVAPLQADEPIRLRVSRDKISEMHPADIAAIVSELDRPTGHALMQTFDTETIADTMQEIEPELQVSILGVLPPERAADVLEEMGPDDAADLLADLTPTERARFLKLMEIEDASEVRKLLTYREDTAGGIMTTEYSTIPLGLTASKALDFLRRSPAAQEDEGMYYVYVVDEVETLRGVIVLRDLVLASPNTPVQEIMEDRPIAVDPQTPQTEVAHIAAKYNLLAVPVIDSNRVLHGIVTVDDAIDAIIPTAWKKRLPRHY